jgi:hypothetical protein
VRGGWLELVEVYYYPGFVEYWSGVQSWNEDRLPRVDKSRLIHCVSTMLSL